VKLQGQCNSALDGDEVSFNYLLRSASVTKTWGAKAKVAMTLRNTTIMDCNGFDVLAHLEKQLFADLQ